MAQVFHEIPAELLRESIIKLSNDDGALLTAGNINLYNSSTVSCRFAFELTFKPIAVCFLRPQKYVIRFVERNEHFTVSYFPEDYKHIVDFFGSKSSAAVGASSRKFEPQETQAGNVFYPQARLVLECRKVFSLELILSPEIQDILASEKNREIYPGGEAPRMFVGEIEHCWFGVDDQRLLRK